MTASSISHLLIPIVIFLVFGFFKKIHPLSEIPQTTLSQEELKKKYMPWDIGTVLGLFVLAPFFGFLSVQFLNVVAKIHNGTLPLSDARFTMSGYYWWIPSIFIGIVCSAPVLDWMIKSLLRPPYSAEEYLAYQTRQAGFKTKGMMKFFVTLAILISLALTVLGMDCYVYLKGNELVVNPYFSLKEARYPLEDVTDIRSSAFFTAPNGDKVARREYVLRFKSGAAWNTNFMPGDVTETEKAAFIDTLSKRSGKPIQEVPQFEKSDLY